MKKQIAVFLSMILLGTISACGSTESTGNQSENTENMGSETNSVKEESSETVKKDGHALVAYFTYSENIGDTSGMELDAISSASLNEKTNNTQDNLQVMAQEIKEKKGADIFHILVEEPYDMDYSTMLPTAIEQMQKEEKPALQESIENFDEYDVIYVGTPVWNSELPPAMQTFFEEYDFSGKTIVPFGIHLGSRFGRMIEQMKELEPQAEVLEGYTVSADTENDEVKSEFDNWLDELTLNKNEYSVFEKSCQNNGQEIYGVVYQPETEEKVPLVIFAHELGASHTSGIPYAEKLASQGVAVYTFDFRGGSANSRSEGRTTEMSVMTEADDIRAVTDEAKEWDFVDSDQIVIIGASQGGAATAVYAAENSNDIKGIILLYPAFVIYDDIHQQFRSLDEVPEKFNYQGWIRVGKNYISDAWDYNFYDEMKKFDKPVLILHGNRDGIVDLSYSRQAVKDYPNTELHVLNGAGHGFYGSSFDEALTFINVYLENMDIMK